MEVRQGYKKTETGIIPDDWEVKFIEDLTPIGKKNGIVDGPFGSNLKTIHYRKSGIPIITSGYVTNGKFLANEYLFVDEEKFKQEKRSAVSPGDIVMAKIGERCGASAILPMGHHQGILSGNALKITIDEKRYVTSLIWQILWNRHQTGDFNLLKTTGAQPAISMANLKKYKIPIPSLKSEQTAIATSLSDADALITSLEKLIAKKQNIKQGAMHQLLKPTKDWEMKTIKEIADNKIKWSFIGGPFGSNLKSADYTSEGVRVIQLQNIGDGNFINDSEIFTSETKADELLSNNIYPGDIILSKMGDPVARACIIPFTHKRYLMCSDGIRLCVDRARHNPYFIFVTINSPHFRSVAANASTGSTRKRIGLKELKTLEIPCPSLEEQNRIGRILMDMNKEISLLESKLEKYHRIKSGMMQNLLTGKIRLG